MAIEHIPRLCKECMDKYLKELIIEMSDITKNIK